MRTEVKIAFVVVPVVVIGCILFFVNESRNAPEYVNELGDIDGPSSEASGDTKQPRPGTTDAKPPRSNRQASANRPRRPGATPGSGTTRDTRRSNRAQTPAQRPQRSADPRDATRSADRAARPSADGAAGSAGPEASATELYDQIRRQLEGASGRSTEESTRRPDTPPATQPAADSSEPAMPKPAITEQPATRPATPRVEPGQPAVSPPQRETARERAPSPGAAGGQRTHTIVSGERLWDIAERYYGNGVYYRRILEANPGLDATRLRVGQEVIIPPREGVSVPAQPATPEEPAARRHTYVVEHGDTLIRIARNLLGDGARWREIYDLNRDQIPNPNVVPVGLELKIPER
jgi:nucleoid-associated protein YgaU